MLARLADRIQQPSEANILHAGKIRLCEFDPIHYLEIICADNHDLVTELIQILSVRRDFEAGSPVVSRVHSGGFSNCSILPSKSVRMSTRFRSTRYAVKLPSKMSASVTTMYRSSRFSIMSHFASPPVLFAPSWGGAEWANPRWPTFWFA